VSVAPLASAFAGMTVRGRYEVKVSRVAAFEDPNMVPWCLCDQGEDWLMGELGLWFARGIGYCFAGLTSSCPAPLDAFARPSSLPSVSRLAARVEGGFCFNGSCPRRIFQAGRGTAMLVLEWRGSGGGSDEAFDSEPGLCSREQSGAIMQCLH